MFELTGVDCTIITDSNASIYQISQNDQSDRRELTLKKKLKSQFYLRETRIYIVGKGSLGLMTDFKPTCVSQDDTFVKC